MRRVAGWLIVVGVVILLVAGAAWWLARRYKLLASQPVAQIEPLPAAPVSASPAPSLTPLPSIEEAIEEATPTPEPTVVTELPSRSNIGDNSFVGTINLIIPVAGVRPQQLLDTFDDARSEGRVHDAIDIPAAAGTPVLAVADGQIAKLFQSEKGGTTIYQSSADKKLIFYYAHLQQYAPGLVDGMFVKQGQVIAYVGDTGNAGAGNYHLHFSIAVVSDPRRYWEGTNINPYPLLHH